MKKTISIFLAVLLAIVVMPALDAYALEETPQDEVTVQGITDGTCYYYYVKSGHTYFCGASPAGLEFEVPKSEETDFAGWDVTGVKTDMAPFKITKAQADAGYKIITPAPSEGEPSCYVTFAAYYHTHTFTTITEPAGYLKNGYTYQECTGCGERTAVTTLEGWSNSYAKSVKVKKGKKSFTVKWKKQPKKKQKEFNGYQIRYSTDPNFGNALYKTAGKKSSSKKIKGAAKTKYFVQVRTYKNVGGVNYYSPWSNTKSVKTK